MTNEMHLERARTAWEAGLNQEMLRHVLAHLEQQATPLHDLSTVSVDYIKETRRRVVVLEQQVAGASEGVCICAAEDAPCNLNCPCPRGSIMSGVCKRPSCPFMRRMRERHAAAAPPADDHTGDDRCSASGCFIQRKNHGAVATHSFRETRTPIAPPAVRGEERALADGWGKGSLHYVIRGVLQRHDVMDAKSWELADAITEELRPSRAASSPAVPTESAERQCECPGWYQVHVTKWTPEPSNGHREYCPLFIPEPDPLPAQTEGGRDANQRMTEAERARLREEARYALPPQPAPTPPPARECAHVWAERFIERFQRCDRCPAIRVGGQVYVPEVQP